MKSSVTNPEFFESLKINLPRPTLNDILSLAKLRQSSSPKRKNWRLETSVHQLTSTLPSPEYGRTSELLPKKRKGNSSNLIIAEKEFNEAFNKLAPQQVIDQPISDEDKQAIWNIPCNIKENNTSYLLTPFSSTEYGEVITTLKTKSAPGPDLISNKIIKKIPPATHSLILKIFNIFYNKGSYPEHWNEFYVVFIPKPGRKGALRLISLANNIHKIFEKLILKRLEWWAENNHILQKYQSGFRRGLSCTDTVSTLITDIHLANQGKKLTGVVFIDLVGAFDNVIPEALIILLSKFGLPNKILKFIKETTSHHHLTGYAAGIALQKRRTTKGLPQGSILSPLLFNIYIYLIHTCIPESIKILAYADDIAIYVSDENFNNIRDQLNLALSRLHPFLKRLGLSIAPTKSYCTIFTNMRTRNTRILLKKQQFSIKINNENIPFSWSPRYLGVYLDPELNWRAHVNQMRNRIIPRINILKAMSGIKWGAHPSTLLTVYKGYIRPVLDWGCQVFYPLEPTLYIKASRLQFAALRVILGMMCSTPTNILLDINSEQPLAARWQYLTEKFLCKVSARTTHPLKHTLTRISKLPDHERSNLGFLVNSFLINYHLFEQVDNFKLPGYLEFPYDCRHLVPMIDTGTGLRISEEANINEHFDQFLKSYNNITTFYTDGSRLDTENRVGYAIFCPETDLEIKI